jgi:hypothetical protein
LNKKYLIKKAKGAFLYNIHDGKYYDLQHNSNILGYSYKKLTTIVKNAISSKWNISEQSNYHKRLKRIFEKISGSDYNLVSAFSLIEFIFRLNNYSLNNSYNLKINGERFNLWIKEKCRLSFKENERKNESIIIYDMTELFLHAKGDNKKFNEIIKKLKKEKITVFNYFWYPYLDIIIENADIIILPEIYSGNFNFLNILVNKNIKNYLEFSNPIESIPLLYILSCFKMYYLIKNIEKGKEAILGLDNIIQAGRIFSYKDLNDYKKIISNFLNENIILSSEPPYYNYFPLNMEDYQIKYLTKIIV